MFIEKSVIFRTSAVYHSHIPGIKTFGDNGFNHPAGVRRVGTWFQYNCISGCNRIDQRINGEQERIIPWAHNQDNTIRRWLLIASGSELGKGSQYCFFFCIGRCMADHVAEFWEHKSHFTHIGFKVTFSKVTFQCFIDQWFIFLNTGL